MCKEFYLVIYMPHLNTVRRIERNDCVVRADLERCRGSYSFLGDTRPWIGIQQTCDTERGGGVSRCVVRS